MTDTRTPGQIYDSMIRARRQLNAVHLILGLIAAFSIWDRLPPHFNAFGRGAGLRMAMLSLFGWLPYAISWRYSRSVFDERSRGVIAFTVGATVITAAAACLYQNVFDLPFHIPMWLISAGVTLILVVLAELCAIRIS